MFTRNYSITRYFETIKMDLSCPLKDLGITHNQAEQVIITIKVIIIIK